MDHPAHYPHESFDFIFGWFETPSGRKVTALSAPPTFFDEPDDRGPIVTGFAGSIYVIFNEDFIIPCEVAEVGDWCPCGASHIAEEFANQYVERHPVDSWTSQ